MKTSLARTRPGRTILFLRGEGEAGLLAKKIFRQMKNRRKNSCTAYLKRNRYRARRKQNKNKIKNTLSKKTVKIIFEHT